MSLKEVNTNETSPEMQNTYLHRINDDCLGLILGRMDYMSLENLSRTDVYFRKRIELFKKQNPTYLDKIIRKHYIDEG